MAFNVMCLGKSCLGCLHTLLLNVFFMKQNLLNVDSENLKKLFLLLSETLENGAENKII